MSAAATHFSLPWRQTRADRVRTWATLAVALGAVLMVGILVPMANLPREIRVIKDVLTMTRVTLAPPVVKPPLPPLQPLRRVATGAQPARPTPNRAVRPVPPAAPVRDAAAIASVNAIDDAFADLRQPSASSLKSTDHLQRGSGQAATVNRGLLTADQGAREVAVGASRGEVGGVALSARAATRVAAPASVRAEGAAAAHAAERAGQRSLEEIRRVFDASKGLLFGLYQAALIDTPGLAGKVVVELTISPGGEVVGARVVSSEIADAQLVQNVLARVRAFRFKAADVGTTTVTYPVHFLPT